MYIGLKIPYSLNSKTMCQKRISDFYSTPKIHIFKKKKFWSGWSIGKLLPNFVPFIFCETFIFYAVPSNSNPPPPNPQRTLETHSQPPPPL